MIVVDTNVVSELVKPDRSWRVVDWFDRNIREIALATPSMAELQIGVLAMTDGRRKAEIGAAYLDIFDLLAERILTFDRAAAMAFADIAISCKPSIQIVRSAQLQKKSALIILRASRYERGSLANSVDANCQ